MRKYLLLFSLVLFPLIQYAQGEFNIWYFGKYAGLDFNSGSPIILNNSSMYSGLSTVSVSDSTGNILFYSHGGRIYNRTHSLMPNGIGLLGTSLFGQPVFAVQNLVDDSLYFLFTVDERLYPFYGQAHGLRYSIIDMRLDGRKGDIIPGQKNLKIFCASKS